jgi:hypothetical protein
MEEKLKQFMEALTGGNDSRFAKFIYKCRHDVISSSSHLVYVPPGLSPTDVILSSPIMQDSPHLGGFGGGTTGGGAADDFGGIDPSLDPDLALALRLSAEESRAQQESGVMYFDKCCRIFLKNNILIFREGKRSRSCSISCVECK